MQFARTTGPFLEHELVDPVDAAGRRLLDDADLDEGGPDPVDTEDDRPGAPAPGGRER
jgi:hypothetical protein